MASTLENRVAQEIALLRRYYPQLEYREAGRWVRISNYALPNGWNRRHTDVAFQIKDEYPAPPYGFYVPIGLTFGDRQPESYNEYPLPQPQPPFAGNWGFFSWQPDGAWFATADVVSGSNLLNFVRTFSDRFGQRA